MRELTQRERFAAERAKRERERYQRELAHLWPYLPAELRRCITITATTEGLVRTAFDPFDAESSES